nr:DUF2264 domain-containing protein [Caldalkalibacillus salinus]
MQTREQVQMALEQICLPTKPYFNRSKTTLQLGATGAGHPDAIAGMEGFARLLWGIIPYQAGGKMYQDWDDIIQGVRNGTHPEHEAYWGDITDYDQRIVEMAAFGLALALIPDQIWEPLSEEERRHFISWLDQINAYHSYDCNWLFFRVLVNLGFKQVGGPYNEEKVAQSLDRIDAFYVGDGWYSDGVNAHCDYYTSFAIHFYSLIYAKLMEGDDPERVALYKQRAGLFAQDFIYWFAKDGSALPYGRSLTYRFAQAGFWSALAYAEIHPFSYGVMKGIILNHLRWWFKQPIFNPNGTLSIGYAYPNLVMAENYNAPGSPYWGLKVFLILALPADHPFWQAAEEPLPPLHNRSVQRPPHFILCRQDDQNHVLAFNAGYPFTNAHTHTSAKYEKFVYSNVFGFSVPRAEWGLEQGAFDSMLALSERDHLYRVKRQSETYTIEDQVIYTKWRPWRDVTVHTWLIVGTPWHVRVHKIQTHRELDAADGGFALGKARGHPSPEITEHIRNETELLVSSENGCSGVTLLYGKGHTTLIHPHANTNLIHPRTVIPTVQSILPVGTHWLVTAFFADPCPHVEWKAWDKTPRVNHINGGISILSREGDALFTREISEP